MNEPEIGEDGTLAMSDQQKLVWKIGGAVVAVLCIMGTVSCATEETSASSQSDAPPKSALERVSDKLAPDYFVPMGRESFAETHAAFGRARFDEANDMSHWAALAAAENRKCPQVEMILLSDKAKRDAFVWYVSCSNGEKFDITEEQARAVRDRLDPEVTAEARTIAEALPIAAPRSERWKDFSDSRALLSCISLTRRAMLVPRTFTPRGTQNMSKDSEVGTVVIEHDYTTENALGMTLNGRFRCTLQDRHNNITGLSIREPMGWRKLI